MTPVITREVMNEAAEGMYRDNFWFGVGPNNYAKVVNYDPYADLIDQSIREKGTKSTCRISAALQPLLANEERNRLLWLLELCCTAGSKPRFRCHPRGCKSQPHPARCGNWHLRRPRGGYLQSTIEHTLVNYSNAYVWMALLGLVQGMPVFGKKPQQSQENESKSPEIVEEKVEMDAPEQQPDKAGDWSYVTGTPVAISSSGEADNENSHRTSNYW